MLTTRNPIILEIRKGSWFRQMYPEHAKEGMVIALKNKNIRFLDQTHKVLESHAHKIKLGRQGKGIDILLDNNLVSKFHCQIIQTMRGWCLEDCKSTNGTFISRDGVMVKLIGGKFPLQKGDNLFIGYAFQSINCIILRVDQS